MKIVKKVVTLTAIGAGIYALALGAMKFAENGFEYLSTPVGEESDIPQFEITEDMKQEAKEKMEEVLCEIENIVDEEALEETPSEVENEEIPEPIWIGEKPKNNEGDTME